MTNEKAWVGLGSLLVLLASAGCCAGEYRVDADIMPGVYPNRLTADQTTIEVALLSPEHVSIRGVVREVRVAASSDFESAAPVVEALGTPELRDVNGDGEQDLVATFSVPQLRQAGVLGPTTTKLQVRASVANLGSCTGTDRLFDVGSPIMSIPAPTGAEPVGTTSTVLHDPSRSGPTSAGRALALRIWYPSVPTAAEPTTYFLDEREAVANVPDGLPANLFDWVHASSVLDAKLARNNGKRPAIILSTGLGMSLAYYAGVAQDLASQGYVVVGIEHPDGSGVVVYPDGTESTFESSTAPDAAWNHRWAADIEYVAGWLSRGPHLPGLGRLMREAVASIDPNRIGALGHSFGGAAAVWAAAESPILRASVNLDGAFWGDVLEAGPATPTMVLLSELHKSIDSTPITFLAHARAPVYLAEVAGAHHNDFGDVATLIEGLSAINPSVHPEDFGVGPIGSSRAFAIESAYLRAFFDWALSMQPSDLLRGPSAQFPEVTLTIQP